VIFVTVLEHKPRTEITRMPQRARADVEWAWFAGFVGVVAGGFGAWMYYVPADWFLGGLVEAWPFGLFIAAGVLLATAFGLYARRAYLDDRRFTVPVVTATVLGLIALAGAITFAVILII
jgi:hypothetical protein